MNISKLVYSFFNVLIAVFFLLSGIIFVLIPWVPAIRTRIVMFLLENPIALSLLGISFVIVGCGFIVNVVLVAQHRYYKIRGGASSALVDEHVIQQYVDAYWTRLFPNCEISNAVAIRNNRIHLTASFPHIPLSQQKNLLQRIERDLTQTFSKTLGYEKEFYLSASFMDADSSAAS